jgi:hypothetical protein
VSGLRGIKSELEIHTMTDLCTLYFLHTVLCALESSPPGLPQSVRRQQQRQEHSYPGPGVRPPAAPWRIRGRLSVGLRDELSGMSPPPLRYVPPSAPPPLPPPGLRDE